MNEHQIIMTLSVVLVLLVIFFLIYAWVTSNLIRKLEANNDYLYDLVEKVISSKDLADEAIAHVCLLYNIEEGDLKDAISKIQEKGARK